MALFELTLVLLFDGCGADRAVAADEIPYPTLWPWPAPGSPSCPGAPRIAIDPDLALALFVAPVLLDAAFDASPRDLKRNWQPLFALALVAVGLTTAAVAFVGWRYAGLPLAAAIALGAIVAPPDAAAATAVLGQLQPAASHPRDPARREPAQRRHRAADLSPRGRRRRRRDLLEQAVPPFAARRRSAALSPGYAARPFSLLRHSAGPGCGERHHPAVRQRHSASGSLPSKLGLSPIITMVVYAMTIARTAPRAHAARDAHQLLFGLGDGRLRAEHAGLRADGPAGAADRRPACRRRAGRAFVFAGAVLVTVILVTPRLGDELRCIIDGPPASAARTKARCADVSRRRARRLVRHARPRHAGRRLCPAGRFPGRDPILLAAFAVVLGTLVLQGITLTPLLRRLRFGTDRPVDVSFAGARRPHEAASHLSGETSGAAAVVRGEYETCCV